VNFHPAFYAIYNWPYLLLLKGLNFPPMLICVVAPKRSKRGITKLTLKKWFCREKIKTCYHAFNSAVVYKRGLFMTSCYFSQFLKHPSLPIFTGTVVTTSLTPSSEVYRNKTDKWVYWMGVKKKNLLCNLQTMTSFA